MYNSFFEENPYFMIVLIIWFFVVYFYLQKFIVNIIKVQSKKDSSKIVKNINIKIPYDIRDSWFKSYNGLSFLSGSFYYGKVRSYGSTFSTLARPLELILNHDDILLSRIYFNFLVKRKVKYKNISICVEKSAFLTWLSLNTLVLKSKWSIITNVIISYNSINDFIPLINFLEKKWSSLDKSVKDLLTETWIK
jgi:hypothetical protein